MVNCVQAPFCNGAVASSTPAGCRVLRRSFPAKGSGEPVSAIALSSWEAPEVGANLEKTGGWRVCGQK